MPKLSHELITALNDLYRFNKDIMLTGSIAIACYGVDLGRPVKDIDIIINKPSPELIQSPFKQLTWDTENMENDYEDIFGSDDYYNLEHENGVKVDVWEMPDVKHHHYYTHTLHAHDPYRFKLVHPQVIVNAKTAIINQRTKILIDNGWFGLAIPSDRKEELKATINKHKADLDKIQHLLF